MRSSFCLSLSLFFHFSVVHSRALLCFCVNTNFWQMSKIITKPEAVADHKLPPSGADYAKFLRYAKKNPLKILISASWYRSAPKSVASRTSHPSIKFHRQQHLSYPVKRHTDKHIGLKNNLLGRGNNTLIMPASWNNHSSKVYITAYIRHVCKI